jgi:UDP-2,3-diacylglucosamine pyrophosphatase LpxH
MSPVHEMRPLRYRTIWISDVHLGFKGCKADYLLDFLKSTESEHLYLVGDIIDTWSMTRNFFWPQTHNNVIRTILGKAKHGTKVVYIPGNHDEIVREYGGMEFGNVLIRNKWIHETADGRRLLLLHGDEFDGVIRYSRFLYWLGDRAYELLLDLNRWYNLLRKRSGLSYWSLASYLKNRIKNAVQVIGDFENAVAHEAAKHNVDGLVCGHIHHAEIKQINGVLYCNDGDWVESCTALVEDHDGSLQLLHWSESQHEIKTDSLATVPSRKIA